MQHAFQAQDCHFFLHGPFSDLIDSHLPAQPISGTRLQLQPNNPACNWHVTIEVDSGGSLASVTVRDVRSPDISHWHWDFIEETFNNCGDEALDLYCGQGIFNIFMHAIPAHFSAGNYTVTTTAI
jgi:hypothetical protein